MACTFLPVHRKRCESGKRGVVDQVRKVAKRRRFLQKRRGEGGRGTQQPRKTGENKENAAREKGKKHRVKVEEKRHRVAAKVEW